MRDKELREDEDQGAYESTEHFARRSNNRRARHALAVLRVYAKGNIDVETACADLLADLMHWGSRKRRHASLDRFEAALDRARGYFAAEEATGNAI